MVGQMSLLRHALSILVLPVTVLVLVPWWLIQSGDAGGTGVNLPAIPPWLGRVLGAAILLGGFALFTWCVALFARIGGGTLAPWDPTRRLVAAGPYRHVRNPMISGVAAMLAGEALIFGSAAIAAWLVIFVIINHIYFVVSEERGLARRFGNSYDAYRAAVPRWIPRRTPWTGQ